jgi:radical SAM protein with 4Fe4S-binding SPASM domain
MILPKEQIKRFMPERLLTIYRQASNPESRRKFLLNKFGIRYTPKVPDFPPMVLIDTSTRCNLTCNHCPNSIISKDENWVGDMELSLYKKTIDEIASESPDTIVRLFNSGEPLMRMDIEELIEYAKIKGIRYVSINTNGVLLTEKRAYNLLKSGLDHIEFSLDAFSEQTYESIKNANFYKRVLDNIANYIKMRDRICTTSKISVSFVKQKDNYHECDAFFSYWKHKVNYVTLREYHKHCGLVDGQGQYRNIIKKYRHPCPYLWNRMIVEHTGKVRFCENDWKAEYAVGDLQTHSIKKIWRSGAYRNLRFTHSQGTFDHPYCKKCTDWKVIC